MCVHVHVYSYIHASLNYACIVGFLLLFNRITFVFPFFQKIPLVGKGSPKVAPVAPKQCNPMICSLAKVAPR